MTRVLRRRRRSVAEVDRSCIMAALGRWGDTGRFLTVRRRTRCRSAGAIPRKVQHFVRRSVRSQCVAAC